VDAVEWGGIYLYDPPTATTSAQGAALVQSGSEQTGLRPFVIVSRDGANKGKPTAVGVPLSTKLTKANSYRILIPVGEIVATANYRFSDSVALCDHVRVIDLSKLRYQIGRMSVTAITAVGNGLANLFDLR